MIKIKFEPPIIPAIPLSPDDLIQVEVISSTVPATIELEGSCFNQQGDIVPFQQSLAVIAALTPTTFRIRLGYQFLLSAVVHTRSSGIPDGSCYVRLTLVKSETSGVFPHRKILSQGYVSTYGSIGYGSAAIQGPPSDHFFVENIAVPDPAAGADVDYVIPDYTKLEIISLTADVLTDATAATRQFSYYMSMPSGNPHVYKSSLSQAAGSNYNYPAAPAQFAVAGTTANSATGSIPYFILTPGCTISAVVFNIQAGDQISGFSIFCKRQTIPFA